MPEAVVGSLAVQGLVPHALGLAAIDRMRRAVESPLPLDAAFEALADLDPGAVWVLRQVQVTITVPASDPDPDRQARRIADGMAAAVEAIVRRGPSADAVRFGSRAAVVAGFVRARLSGVGVGWVFERFAALGPLPVAGALIAAARIVEVDLLDVVAELAGPAGEWPRLVWSLPGPEAARLLAAIVAQAGTRLGAAPTEGPAVTVGHPYVLEPGAARDAPPGPQAALMELGGLLAANALTPARLATLAAAGEADLPRGDRAGQPVTAGSNQQLDPAATEPQQRFAPATAPVSGEPTRPHPVSFTALGAAAFVLLPDLEELLGGTELAARTDAAGRLRATVLAGVFGGTVPVDDPGLALAAGLDAAADPAEVVALIKGPLTALANRFTDGDVAGFVHPNDRGRFGPDPVATLSGVLFRRFALHLHGFDRASAGHLVPRVLPLGGWLRVTDDLIAAVLPPAQLGVLLSLAGLDAFACRPPWLAERVLVSHQVSP